MKFAKILFLQFFWYLAVSTNQEYQNITFLLSLIFAFLNFIVFKPQVTVGHYLFTMFCFITYGTLQEVTLNKLGLVTYNQSTFPIWLTSLYIVFIGYYGDVFNYLLKLHRLLVFFIGFFGGVSAYYGGVRISPLEVHSLYYYLFVGIGWGGFMLISLEIFYKSLFWNKLLDSTIYFSFDKSGFLRHQKKFSGNLHFKENSFAFITGGTSGIGQATSVALAKNNVNVTITGRDKQKGELASSAHDKISFIPWDMANWEQLDTVTDAVTQLDYVVLNAGGMPSSFQVNKHGYELQFASQLIGHYQLIKMLKKKGKLEKNCKIVWVTSGGMYLANLDLSTIFENKNYDKVSTYANVKRAQVTLLPYLKKTFPNQTITAMHPGWAETPGVSSAIPEFDRKMKGKLRSPAEAADTILWLLGTLEKIESGGLYFDRMKVRKHLFWFTKKSVKKLDELVRLISVKY